MTDVEIEEFIKKWGLTPTQAAYILGISLSTLAGARAGKRLHEATYRLMIHNKAKYESSKDGYGDLPPAA